MSSAIVHEGTLDVGIEIAGKVHKAFRIRPAALTDHYRATAAVPPVEDLTNLAQRAAYIMAVDDAVILSQLEALGDLAELPSITELAGLIDPDDMQQLRGAAEDVKKKLKASRSGSAPGAESSSPSSVPGSA